MILEDVLLMPKIDCVIEKDIYLTWFVDYKIYFGICVYLFCYWCRSMLFRINTIYSLDLKLYINDTEWLIIVSRLWSLNVAVIRQTFEFCIISLLTDTKLCTRNTSFKCTNLRQIYCDATDKRLPSEDDTDAVM